MTKPELIDRAKRQLNAGGQPPRVWPESEIDIGACVMQAISEVADKAMRDGALRTLLQQVYSVTLDGSGVGDLLAATGSITGVAGEILMEGIKYGVVIDAENNILHLVEHYADFLRPQALVFDRYCLKDRKIHTCRKDILINGPADIQGVTGPLAITASFSPLSVTHIPPELEDVTVHALCGIVALKMPADANPK